MPRWGGRGVPPIPVPQREGFVELVCRGLSLRAAAAGVGVSSATATRLWRRFGHVELTADTGPIGGVAGLAATTGASPGVRPEVGTRVRRALSSEERAQVQLGRAAGLSYAQIAELVGRDKSVIWREVQRNGSPDGQYRAAVAHRVAARRRQRPKPFKLVEQPQLCRQIETWMDDGWSPGLIAAMLAAVHGADHTRRVSHETIYQALYVQARGTLRADLSQKLSLKRPRRVARGGGRTARNYSPFAEALKIRDRPAQVDDRAVPGHWEGDLIMGVGNRSAIGTLVERSTRFTILLHLPGRHDAVSVADAMIRAMRHLPDHLRRSVTWDRGSELADYARVQLALDADLFFCDPRSPWQRGTNENTNRLLRFWFEKGSDLSSHTAADLRRIADTLNKRPRPTLDLETPADRLNKLLLEAA